VANAAALLRRPRTDHRRRPHRMARRQRPADQPLALCHGDYKVDNVLFAARRATAVARHRRLGDGVDRRPARRPRVGIDLSSHRHHAAGYGERARVLA
jgi:aminoglycoside phosphotransferase